MLVTDPRFKEDCNADFQRRLEDLSRSFLSWRIPKNASKIQCNPRNKIDQGLSQEWNNSIWNSKSQIFELDRFLDKSSRTCIYKHYIARCQHTFWKSCSVDFRESPMREWAFLLIVLEMIGLIRSFL
jgi:hypothetical protein